MFKLYKNIIKKIFVVLVNSENFNVFIIGRNGSYIDRDVDGNNDLKQITVEIYV